LAAGLLFGAYHFGTGSDGASQAEHFLDVVQPNADTVVVLDFESNPAGPSMTLEEARAFVTHIKSELESRIILEHLQKDEESKKIVSVVSTAFREINHDHQNTGIRFCTNGSITRATNII
jgi:hypothetical protein